MVPTIIGLLLTLVVVLWLRWGLVEGFTLPAPGHQEYVDTSQKKLNALTNLINLPDPVVPVRPATAKDMYQATHYLDAKPTETLHALTSDTVHEIPDHLPIGLERAIGCQKAPKTCAAFDSPSFAENCGMSFDKQGVGSDGKPHIGGMYVAPDDRAYQTTAAEKVVEERKPPYDPYRVYQPSIGAAKAGAFSLTKDQCVVVKEKIDCDEKQTFNSPNCTQCFPSQSFTRVAKDTPRVGFTLYLAGQGVFIMESSDIRLMVWKSGGTPLNPNTPYEIKIPAEAEGTRFTISVYAEGPSPTYLAGYIVGNTGRGPFKIDMLPLIAKDEVTGVRPRMMGMKTVQGFRCLAFVPAPKKQFMKLACMVPFSFLSPYEPDAIYCDNGPLITTEASATHLESDPCYGKKNAPGNYKLECLQSRWTALGGLPEGLGYPNTQAKADAIQREGGRALSLDDIMDRMSVKMTEAIMGQRESGAMMTIPEWNEISMWGLGIPINSPCDGLQKDEGPLSKACLNYLYDNRGATSHVGSTFTLPTERASLKEGFALPGGGLKEGFAGANEVPNTFLYPGTAIDPANPSGVAFGQRLGGVEAVKQELDHIHRMANDNTMTNTARATAVKQAYGIDLPPPSSSNTISSKREWVNIPGSLKQVDVDEDVVCGVNRYDDIYCKSDLTSSNWRQLPGKLKHVSVSNGKLYGVNSADAIWYADNYLSPNWTQIPGGLKQVDVDKNVVCGVNSIDDIWCKGDLTSSNWRKLPGKLKHVSVSDGKLYGVNSADQIWHADNYQNPNWTQIPGGLKQVNMDKNTVCGVTSANDIFCKDDLTSSNWRQIPGKLKHVSVSNENLYGVYTDDSIYAMLV